MAWLIILENKEGSGEPGEVINSPLKGLRKYCVMICLAFLLQSCKPSRQNQRSYCMPIIFMFVEVLSWFREQNKFCLNS